MTYFEWLEHQVVYFDNKATYHKLLKKLYSMAYIPIIEMDENRAVDGVHIRNDYFGEYGPGQNVIDSPCSFLEFLLALARRMNYIYANSYEDRTKDCFWTLIRNIGLDNLDDSVYDGYIDVFVEGVVENIVYRRFKQNGEGGLFPLQHPRENQRNVEVWYQMNQYLAEAMSEEGRL